MGARDGRSGTRYASALVGALICGLVAIPAPASAVAPDAVVAAAATPTGTALWTVTDGGVVSGTLGAHVYGRLPYGFHPRAMASTATGHGYWIATASGAVYAFGDAVAHGGVPASIVAMASTPSGAGYWLLSSDGNVYARGDAHWYGAMARSPAPPPMVGIARTPTGLGYWLAASNGRVWGFGDAVRFRANTALPSSPIVSIAATADGLGYRLLAANGAVATFGSAPLLGRLGVAASAIVATGTGYWIAGRDGDVRQLLAGMTAQQSLAPSPWHGPHTYLGRVGDQPSRWNPCAAPIRVGWQLAGRDFAWTVVQAALKVSAATGLQFSYVGAAPADIEVVVKPFSGSWGSTSVSAMLNAARTINVIHGATIAVNANRPTNAGWTGYGTVGPLLLHEFGHAVGLNHVYATNEAMNPDSRLTDYGPGDREGLWHLGAYMGCT